jgi:hypothetical protein
MQQAPRRHVRLPQHPSVQCSAPPQQPCEGRRPSPFCPSADTATHHVVVHEVGSLLLGQFGQRLGGEASGLEGVISGHKHLGCGRGRARGWLGRGSMPRGNRHPEIVSSDLRMRGVRGTAQGPKRGGGKGTTAIQRCWMARQAGLRASRRRLGRKCWLGSTLRP